ncbi:hypothetical protein K9B35_04925 [Sphingomonas sp. R647]|uniref:hypothetical protein n=1 Tax=Sphingomonas sp. R647 TaxID=2875233 RepID=UPI001CD40E6A|nr:hypothetical protein [Sphingomonas sp. R647]MCA1197301.1 hypothetical protein [Sphingomonas sp. R647]
MADEEQDVGDTLLETLGFTVDELVQLPAVARALVSSARARRAFGELEETSPETISRICQTLLSESFAGGLSQAGKYSLVLAGRSEPSPLQSWPALLDRLFAEPPVHRDAAEWWLLFTTLATSIDFQLGVSVSPHRENRLTGHLLQSLASHGKTWGALLARLQERTRSRLAVHEIDLELLGGEQSTGGDFGLILEVDGRTVEPPERGSARERIVPFIFQAKRYERPYASVSQHNSRRGYQRDLLASNECASAYIFYENGDRAIPAPLPPLVKPVEAVTTYDRTNVLEDSVDFATYLLSGLKSEHKAPRARDPSDALRMIFSGADIGQLASLVVVSGSPDSLARYTSALTFLGHELRSSDDEQWVTQSD